LDVTFRPPPATGNDLCAYCPSDIKSGKRVKIILDMVEITSWGDCQDVAGDAGSMAVLVSVRVAVGET
jgi:hypothetical protein